MTFSALLLTPFLMGSITPSPTEATPQFPLHCAQTADDSDPFFSMDQTLHALADAGMELGRPRFERDLRGTACIFVVTGKAQDLLYQLLEQRAEEDGFIVAMIPLATMQVELIIRPALATEQRGIVLTGVDKVSITGHYLPKDTAQRLERVLGLDKNYLIPLVIRNQLQQLGYRVRFLPVAQGEISIHIRPGRSIRRVRVHGHIPLSKQSVIRALSIDARPGALAYGECASPRALRKTPRPDFCQADDLACQAWKQNEINRLTQFLFDQGYLKGKVDIGLACGRSNQEADLHIYLHKGPAYRASPREITIVGNAPNQDTRWLKRTFWPRIKATPFTAPITRRHMEDAKLRVLQKYAEPQDDLIRKSPSSALNLPYPDVQIETNYDHLQEEDIPEKPRLPLTIRIDTGLGVQTSFLSMASELHKCANTLPTPSNVQQTELKPAQKRKTKPLSFSDKRLLRQLKLFKTRKSPSQPIANDEAATLRAFYQSKGYLLAKVTGCYVKFGRSPSLIFQIDEGPKVRARRVQLSEHQGVPPEVESTIHREFYRERKVTRGDIVSEADLVEDLRTLIRLYNEQGYLCAQAKVNVAFWPEGFARHQEHATIDVQNVEAWGGQPVWAERDLAPQGLRMLRSKESAPVYVRMHVNPGVRVFTSPQTESVRYLETPIPSNRDVSDVPFTEEGNWGPKRILHESPLRRNQDSRPGGVPVTPGLERDAEQFIINRYRNSGFPLADVKIRWQYRNPKTKQVHLLSQTERIPSEETGLCTAHASGSLAEVEPEINVYEGRKGKFGDTLIRGNFKTRSWVLEREFAFKPGADYDQAAVEKTRTHIDRIGIAESVTVTPYPVGCELESDADACVVHQVIEIREAKDIFANLSGGFGFATLDPIYIFLEPSFPNLFGTAWDLDLHGHYGFGSIFPNLPFAGDCNQQRCFERSARATLTRRRFLASPLTLQLSGQFQQRFTPARGEITSALGVLNFSWNISRRWQTYFGYLIQRSNISKNLVKPTTTSVDNLLINRSEAVVADRTGALQLGVTYTNVEDNPFNPEDGMIAEMDGLFASPYLGGLDWWLRIRTSWQHFIPIPRTSNRLNFRYALHYGHAIPLPGAHTTSVPEVWRFFGGGTVDLGLRGIAPETMLVDVEAIDQGFGVKRLRYTAVGGHIRALATLALQMVSVRDFLGGKLAHSLFVDLGILAQQWKYVQMRRDFRQSVGINFIKWDIRLATVSLGYAILIPNSISPGNVRPIDDKNGRFVFDVGVTF